MAPHAATWTAFPSAADLWLDDLAPAQAEVAAMVRAIAAGERVELLVANDAAMAVAKAHARRLRCRFSCLWLWRHLAARYRAVVHAIARLAMRRRVSASTAGAANMICPAMMAWRRSWPQAAGVPLARHGWVLEGGAIDCDGTGLAVTTEQCLLNPNRNPKMDQDRGRIAPAARSGHRPGAVARRRADERSYRWPCR